MLGEAMGKALNDQLNRELSASYTYLSMSAWCEAANFSGFARWLKAQAKEELEHALKIYDHICDRGGRVALRAVDQPPGDFPSVLGVFEQGMENERAVTASIQRLYDLAVQEKDYAAQVLLSWFITEQVEEEKLFGEVVVMLQRAAGNDMALLMLDREMAGRE